MSELYELQLTTNKGQVAVFTFDPEELNSPQLHALAQTGLFEVAVRDYGMKVWSVIDGRACYQCEVVHPDNITNDHWTVCLECAWECGECGEIGADPQRHGCEHSITCDDCSTVVYSDWYYTDGDSRAICGKCYGSKP